MKRQLPLLFLAILLAILLSVVIRFFETLPIAGTTLAMDWKGLWNGIKGGVPVYGNATGLRITPWNLPLVLPLGFLSLRASWGVVSLLTLAALVASLPRMKSGLFVISAILLTVSFPTLRTIADGNFEFLVITGLVVLLAGLQQRKPWLAVLGGLLAAAKIQETWLLLLYLPFLAWKKWGRRELAIATGTFLIVTVPALLWKGMDWWRGMFAIAERGSIMDSSLLNALTRLGSPALLTGTLWLALLAGTLCLAMRHTPALSREKMGLLIAASLLLAPYAAGNSFLTVYAIGIIPLLVSWPAAGWALVVLTNLPFLLIGRPDLMAAWSARYWTALLLISWAAFCMRILRAEFGWYSARQVAPAVSD